MAGPPLPHSITLLRERGGERQIKRWSGRESRVKFNGRKTKPGGEKDRLIDILCGRKCVDFSRPLCHELFSQFWTAVFLKIRSVVTVTAGSVPVEAWLLPFMKIPQHI